MSDGMTSSKRFQNKDQTLCLAYWGKSQGFRNKKKRFLGEKKLANWLVHHVLVRRSKGKKDGLLSESSVEILRPDSWIASKEPSAQGGRGIGKTSYIENPLASREEDGPPPPPKNLASKRKKSPINLERDASRCKLMVEGQWQDSARPSHAALAEAFGVRRTMAL